MQLNRTKKAAESSLIPPFEHSKWTTWAVSDILRPDFSKETDGGETVLVISSNGSPYCFGKWLCSVDGIQSGKTYRFRVECKTKHISRQLISTSEVLTWRSSDDTVLFRNYVDDRYDTGGDWLGHCSIITAPTNAISLQVELHFKWSPEGIVRWRSPSLIECSSNKKRKVTLCTTLIRKYSRDPQKNLQKMLALIDRAGKNRPDIICLTETPFNNDTGLSPEEIAQPIPGSLTEEISQRAAEHKTYITFSMIERDGDFFYNTAVLIDKTGNLLGTYRKTHLPLVETEKGIVPGDDYPVFNTEFGCIGIMICWDHWFPETARILRLKGAEIIFVLSQRNPLQDKSNLIQSQARAVDNGVYLVVAGVYGRNASTIIDPEGTVIGKVASLGKDYCITEIDLNKKYLTPYLSVGSIGEGKSIYIKERRTDTYGILSEQ